MSMEDYSSEGNAPSAWDTIGPLIITAGTYLMGAAFIAAGLGALYLLYALFSGNLAGLATLPPADRTRLMGVVMTAGKALAGGLAIGSVCALVVTWGEESTGYILLGGVALLGVGVPFIYNVAGGQGAGNGPASPHVNIALAQFIHAAYIPGIVGAGLSAWDIVKRLASGVKPKTLQTETFTYGGAATADARPRRTSLLAKCWEGPYCREFIRTTCPIFIARKACWREKRGCYCEEDIVSSAAAKVQGIQLDMAPPTISIVSGGGVANVGGGPATPIRRVELSHRQKVERCKHCVIYNEHEREKYKLLMPVTIVGTFLLCFLMAVPLRHFVGTAFGTMDSVLAKISFDGGGSKFSGISETAEWVLVGALSLMVVSKALQVVEWACFKAKI